MAKPVRRPQGYARPLCLCGCGRFVKHAQNKYASVACVPRTVRSEAAKKGRRSFAYRRRAVLFRAAVQRLAARGSRRVSQEDLFAVLMDVYRTGYGNGYHACHLKLRHAAKEAA